MPERRDYQCEDQKGTKLMQSIIAWWMGIEPEGVRYLMLLACFLIAILIAGIAGMIWNAEYHKHLDGEDK